MASTEAPEKSTREQVEELFDSGTTEAKDIAEALGKSPASVYVHLRKIAEERGLPKRPRGRPKANSEDGDSKPATKPAKAPAKASGNKSEAPKAARPAPSRSASSKSAETTEANGNGNLSGAERFPLVAEAIQNQLREKQREVEVLEKMLAGITK